MTERERERNSGISLKNLYYSVNGENGRSSLTILNDMLLFSSSNSATSSRNNSFLKSRSLTNENKVGQINDNFEIKTQIEATNGIIL